MFWILSGAILILDRVIKNYITAHFVLRENHVLIDGILSLLYVQNRGAAFSILTGQRWLLFMIAAVTICGILWYRHRYPLKHFMDISLGLIVGGALGNMIDRFLYGYVIDYISVGWWPVFNLADMAIVCGGACLFIQILQSSKTEGETNEAK